MRGPTKRRFGATLACLLLATLARAQTAPGGKPFGLVEKTFTLEDAERLALLNDARLLSAEQDKVIADERVREAFYLFFPEVGLQSSATKYQARYPFSLSGDFRNILLFPDQPPLFASNTGNIYSGRAYMTTTLYEGGRGVNTLRLAQAAQKQAVSDYESVRMDIALAVKAVFYKLLLAQERVRAADAYRTAVEKAVKDSRLDVWERMEAEARVGEARAKSSDALHQLDLQRLEFLKNLNLELDTPFKVTGTLETKPLNIDIEKAALWAIELRPELQSETYKAQMDEISVNLAQARRIPTVFLASDYELTGVRFPLRENNWDATIGLRIPFSYDYWSQLKQRRAEQRQGQLKRAELQDRVRLEVRQAYENLQYWQREFPMREKEYRSVQTLYDEAGAGDARAAALGRIRALSGLLDLKLHYLTAVQEHILALAHLERAVGRDISP